MAGGRLRLGCPVFGARAWVGEVLPASTPAHAQLREYARIFDAVEGNGTFYGLPAPQTIERWAEATPEGFRFAFKLPRAITHETRLGAPETLRAFVELLRPLGPRVGPVMVQLPPRAGRAVLPALSRLLERLPPEWPRAVELRHPDWFDDGPHEQALHGALAEAGAERVCLDSRALFSAPADDPSTEGAQGRKPRVPARAVGLGPHPVVRFIGRNRPEACDPWLRAWAPVIAGWLAEGRQPLVFAHTPDERHAPALARRLHGFLREARPELEPLPAWPLGPAPGSGAQLSLL